MTTEEILKVVAEEQPEMMAKIAEILHATSTLFPALVPEVMQDFDTICSVVNEKTAASGTPNFRAFAIGAGGAAAGGLLSAITTDLYDAAKRGLTKGRNFSRIMEFNPNLKREVDKKQLSAAYNALHRFAPDFTADPMVGGALLKQVAELPQMSHKTIFELIGAEKNLNDGKGRHFQEMSKLGPILVPDNTEHTRSQAMLALEDKKTQSHEKSQENQARRMEAMEAVKHERSKTLEGVRHDYARRLEDYRNELRNTHNNNNTRPGE
jgi:hypothetical protein